jgi:hypothetical protein
MPVPAGAVTAQGRYKRLVQNAKEAIDIPMVLYIRPEVIMTILYGMPW